MWMPLLLPVCFLLEMYSSWQAGYRRRQGESCFPFGLPIRIPAIGTSAWNGPIRNVEDARPELVENVENLDQYDTIFLGYPNWWYGVPMVLLTFLEENDLSGKQVYLFCSHGTGGLADSVGQITEAAPEAVISDDIFLTVTKKTLLLLRGDQSWTEGLGY